MKVKVIIAALLLAGAGMSANAQSTDDNWFLQGQLGASYSLEGPEAAAGPPRGSTMVRPPWTACST